MATTAPTATGSVSPRPGRQARAIAHESLLYLASHPLIWPLSLASSRWPMLRLPGIGVVVNDPILTKEILQRDRDFTKTGPGSMGPHYDQVLGPYALLNMDGAPHRELRARLAGVFSPAGVAATVEEVFATPLADATAPLAAGGTVDLADLARDLTGRMTCHLLGITPPAGTERATALRVSRLAERLTSLVPLSDRPLSPRRIRAFRQPLDDLTETARQSYDDPNLPPTAIVRRLREAGLDFAETRGVLASLFVVGTQTVAVALPRIVALLIDTGQWGRLRQHPELLPGAIDEGLRCTAPTPASIRAVARPLTLAGHQLDPGERLILLTHNCAKNPRLFPAPWRYDPARVHPPEARHLWFGAGPHFCLGFALAQEELRFALRALTVLPNDLVIVSRRPSFGFLPRYERLIVRAQ